MKILMIKAALGAASVAVVAFTLHIAPSATPQQGFSAHQRQPLVAWSQSFGQFVSGLFTSR